MVVKRSFYCPEDHPRAMIGIGQVVVPMFGWLKSEQRERRKKVKQDRKHLEERARRFLKTYRRTRKALIGDSIFLAKGDLDCKLRYGASKADFHFQDS